jgi:hypothetical protein
MAPQFHCQKRNNFLGRWGRGPKGVRFGRWSCDEFRGLGSLVPFQLCAGGRLLSARVSGRGCGFQFPEARPGTQPILSRSPCVDLKMDESRFEVSHICRKERGRYGAPIHFGTVRPAPPAWRSLRSSKPPRWTARGWILSVSYFFLARAAQIECDGPNGLNVNTIASTL